MNIKLLIAYDGSGYFGWQKTQAGPSIEGTLQSVLEQLLQEKICLQAASRTDKGVHADGQVVNFITSKTELDLQKLHKSLNSLLPKDLCILEIEEKCHHFHPTLDAKAKEYHYTLCLKKVQMPFDRLFSWHIPHLINVEEMQKACAFFIGAQDFSSFCNERSLYGRETFCTIEDLYIQFLPQERCKICIRGNRFLYKMVRNIVGTLVYIGLGKLQSASLCEMFDKKQRACIGVTAPAHGLSLKQVFYAPHKALGNIS